MLSDVQTFIELSRSVSSARDLDRLVLDIAREMGFDHYALVQHVDLTAFSSDLRHMDEGKLVALWHYPEAWVEVYHERYSLANCPILMASQRTNVGFTWSDLPNFIKVTPLHRAIVEDSRRAGLAEGFTVPAHIPGEAIGSCCFAVKWGRALPSQNLPMAQLVGSFAFHSARTMVENARKTQLPTSNKPLGNRQLECISLLARGKTDWEISRIMGISELTVRRHITLAKERYGVASRVQLAMRAIFEGKLTLSDIMS